MSHRADPDREPARDTREVAAVDLDEDYQRDLTALLAASTRLRDIGEQVDEAQRAVITLAVEHAVEEASRIARIHARRASRRGYTIVVVVAVLISLLISLPFAVTGYTKGQQAAATATALAAGDAASSEVTSARASSLFVIRRDLANVINPARVRAGLDPCADPGPTSNAYQVTWVAGMCAGELRTFADLAKRGQPVPGVNAPDPSSGAFPEPAH